MPDLSKSEISGNVGVHVRWADWHSDLGLESAIWTGDGKSIRCVN